MIVKQTDKDKDQTATTETANKTDTASGKNGGTVNGEAASSTEKQAVATNHTNQGASKDQKTSGNQTKTAQY